MGYLMINRGVLRAITVRYIGPTNTKPARVKAQAGDSPSVVRTFNRDQDYDDAAHELCKLLGWEGKLYRGTMKLGYVYVFGE